LPEETQYLCAAVSEHFTQPVTPAKVFWSFAGVRPLFRDGGTEAPLLSVFGGKITTYRRRPAQPTIGLRYRQYSSTCCTICGGLIHI
jgi:glycerol-3-phosphate dehydrogenase